MRRTWTALALAAMSACVGFNIDAPLNCAELCQRAADCGFLPSMLGWDPGGDRALALASCEQRCGNSPRTDPTTATIVACLESEADATTWCDDAASEHAAAWSRCSAIQSCVADAFPENELIGDVRLSVQLLRFAEFEAYFEPVAALYADREANLAAPLSSCEPALCGQEACKHLECEPAACADTDTGSCGDDVCTVPADEICSPTMCRVGSLTVADLCDALGIQRITLKLYNIRGRFPVTHVFQDAVAGINANCATSVWETQTDGSYRIKPGPLQVDAEVIGELPASALAPLGLLPDGTPADETPTQYCVKFLGPTMITRAGENATVVPLGDLGDLASLAAQDLLLPCEP